MRIRRSFDEYFFATLLIAAGAFTAICIGMAIVGVLVRLFARVFS